MSVGLKKALGEVALFLLHHGFSLLASILLNDPLHLQEIGTPPPLVHHWPMSEIRSNLAGKTVLITRAETQAGTTAIEIIRRGGHPLCLPCLELECLKHNILKAMDLLQDDRAEVLFTSRNGVECVAAVLDGKFGALMQSRRVMAVGQKTAATLGRFGVATGTLPDDASQAGLIEAYRKSGIPEKLLFFRAEEGNDTLSDALSSAGSDVTTVHAYRMKCPQSDASEIIRKMERHEIDAVLLGSPKTVANYIRRIGNIDTANIPAIAVISPNVARFAEDAGLSVQAIAKSASFDAMLDALAFSLESH